MEYLSEKYETSEIIEVNTYDLNLETTCINGKYYLNCTHPTMLRRECSKICVIVADIYGNQQFKIYLNPKGYFILEEMIKDTVISSHMFDDIKELYNKRYPTTRNVTDQMTRIDRKVVHACEPRMGIFLITMNQYANVYDYDGRVLAPYDIYAKIIKDQMVKEKPWHQLFDQHGVALVRCITLYIPEKLSYCNDRVTHSFGLRSAQEIFAKFLNNENENEIKLNKKHSRDPQFEEEQHENKLPHKCRRYY